MTEGTRHPDKGVHLLAYANRFGGNIERLGELARELGFTGVHILPFFTPFDGVDAGFDPVDHTKVDSRLGDWSDVRRMADDGLTITADLIVNHVSASSPEFQDWLAKGSDSKFDGMFLTFDTVFPDGGTEEMIAGFYRPRPGLPFTTYQLADGTRRLVWTTFEPTQIDIDVEHPAGQEYLRRVAKTLGDAGVGIVRIDAVRYAIKRAGSHSFMTEETFRFVEGLTKLCREQGMKVLVETHAHYTKQIRFAPLVDYVYDFALPPLLLHSVRTGTIERLAKWMSIRPTNAVTVLDTHDGIGVIDAGPDGDLEGLINHDEMAALFDWAAYNTEFVSSDASILPAFCKIPHQINSTFFSVLGRNESAYLMLRAIQLFTPGLPQVYYHGLVAGENDIDQWKATGVGREIGRPYLTDEQVSESLKKPVVKSLRELIKLRNEHEAFDGTFTFTQTGDASGRWEWTNNGRLLRLDARFDDVSFDITDGYDTKA